MHVLVYFHTITYSRLPFTTTTLLYVRVRVACFALTRTCAVRRICYVSCVEQLVSRLLKKKEQLLHYCCIRRIIRKCPLPCALLITDGMHASTYRNMHLFICLRLSRCLVTQPSVPSPLLSPYQSAGSGAEGQAKEKIRIASSLPIPSATPTPTAGLTLHPGMTQRRQQRPRRHPGPPPSAASHPRRRCTGGASGESSAGASQARMPPLAQTR